MYWALSTFLNEEFFRRLTESGARPHGRAAFRTHVGCIGNRVDSATAGSLRSAKRGVRVLLAIVRDFLRHERSGRFSVLARGLAAHAPRVRIRYAHKLVYSNSGRHMLPPALRKTACATALCQFSERIEWPM